MSYQTISVDDARQLLQTESVTVLDIRDGQSFSAGHIDNALHAEAIDVDKFIAEADKDKPLLVYCFHGISSQSAAQFLSDSGFTRVFSMEGGYAAWPEA
jgi:thiosulfate sulfurtransferase